MKVLLILGSIMSFPWAVLAQQDSSGVYESVSDFEKSKLSYAINCKTEKHKIKRTDYYQKGYIKVIHRDSTIMLPKDSIFGFRDCDGNSFRLIDGRSYKILNPTEYILIYKHEVRHHKHTAFHYVFSRGPRGEITTLTRENLKKAFPENTAFQNNIDQVFRKDSQLTQYDKLYKMYLINQIYQRVK